MYEKCYINKVLICVRVLQEATEGQGVDVILEMLSNVNLSKDLQMVAYGGRVAVSRSAPWL